MNIQYNIRKSRFWAFDGKNYQAIDNQGELSAYPKKQPRTFAITSGTPYRNYGKRNLIISSNGLVDDSNNYVNQASKKRKIGILHKLIIRHGYPRKNQPNKKLSATMLLPMFAP